ncbi:hypothetical protein AAFJ72_20500 [Brevibacillus gelatini]|nr:hypothetical protein [Brevibacillus gelatini]
MKLKALSLSLMLIVGLCIGVVAPNEVITGKKIPNVQANTHGMEG